MASVMEPANFDDFHSAVRDDPRVKEAGRLYGELIEKPTAQNHAVNEGVFSNAPGPAGRQIDRTRKGNFFWQMPFNVLTPAW